MTTTFIDKAKLGFSELVVKMLILKSVNNTSWYEFFYRALAVMMYIDYAETFKSGMFTEEELNHIEFKIRDIINISDGNVGQGDLELPSGNYRVTDLGEFRLLDDGGYRII